MPSGHKSVVGWVHLRSSKGLRVPRAYLCAQEPKARPSTTYRNPPPNPDFLHDGGRNVGPESLSRARRDGLHRTYAPPTMSVMAGRDCLPATPSDSGTHAQRAYAYREQQDSPFMRLQHASGSTPRHRISSSRHVNKAWMRSVHALWLQRKPQTMHPISFPRLLLLANA